LRRDGARHDLAASIATVTVILVPYHQDERLPDGSIPLPSDGDVVVVTADLLGDDIWQRLTALYGVVAKEVAAQVASRSAPMVVSGDCLVALGVVAGV
jgi:arginase family enzyme